MKRLNLVILAIGATAAWYLSHQLSQIDTQTSNPDASEYINQGTAFWTLSSIGNELEKMQLVIAESLPIFIAAFAIIGILIYIQLCQKALEKEMPTTNDELVD